MDGERRRFLNFANVSAVLALVVALSSGAYAITIARNSIGHKHLRDGAVGTDNLRFLLGGAGGAPCPATACPQTIPPAETFTTIASSSAAIELFIIRDGVVMVAGGTTLSHTGTAPAEVTLRTTIDTGNDRIVETFDRTVAPREQVTIPLSLTEGSVEFGREVTVTVEVRSAVEIFVENPTLGFVVLPNL